MKIDVWWISLIHAVIHIILITFSDDMDWKKGVLGWTFISHRERACRKDYGLWCTYRWWSFYAELRHAQNSWAHLQNGKGIILILWWNAVYIFRYVSNATKLNMIVRQSINDLDLASTHPNGQLILYVKWSDLKSVKLIQIDPWNKSKWFRCD